MKGKHCFRLIAHRKRSVGLTRSRFVFACGGDRYQRTERKQYIWPYQIMCRIKAYASWPWKLEVQKMLPKTQKNKNAPTGKISFNMKCNFFSKLRNKINQSVGLGVACAGVGVHWNRRRRLLGITCIAVHCGGSSVEHNPHPRFTR